MMSTQDVLYVLVSLLTIGSAMFPIIMITKYFKTQPRSLRLGAGTFGAIVAFVATILVGMYLIHLIANLYG